MYGVIEMDYMGLLSESQQKQLKDRHMEVQKFVGYELEVKIDFSLQDDKELFVEFFNDTHGVLYRLLFKVNTQVGRPAVGLTKKVSITLPDEVWQQLDQLQKDSGCRSRSEMMRKIIFNILDVKEELK